MTQQPLAEVFGFPVDNFSERAVRYRDNRLCPYNNRVANCTKDKANDPLGVCSIFDAVNEVAITCPVRFRQDWLIADDAAQFFFSPGSNWTSLAEVRLNDRNGVSAGNIDIVLVAYDERGRILDFGALEIQAVYISGNVRRVFEEYTTAPQAYVASEWAVGRKRPRPDYLSSSRKRLVPQLLYKGSILKAWGKKQAVALHRRFYETLPSLDSVSPDDADMAWLVYDLIFDEQQNIFNLTLHNTVYTPFESTLNQIVTPEPGDENTFLASLQTKLDDKLGDDATPPDTATLDELL